MKPFLASIYTHFLLIFLMLGLWSACLAHGGFSPFVTHILGWMLLGVIITWLGRLSYTD